MTLKTNKIHLFRSVERAQAYSKKLAQAGTFYGHKCTTPQLFARGLAEAAGFQDEIISDNVRLGHLLSVVSSTDDYEAYEYFSKPQNLMFLIEFIKKAAGTTSMHISFDELDADCSFLEESTVLVVEEYESVINAFGLEEFGFAARAASEEFEGAFEVLYEDDCCVSPAICECIERVAANRDEPSFSSFNQHEKEVDERTYSYFTLAETRAKIPVFVDVLKELGSGSSVAVVTNDVEDDARILSRLSAQMKADVQIAYTQKKRFLDTNFGQALRACDEALNGNPKDVELKFSDFMHNPLSGISLYKCLELEKDLRANPNVARQRVADELKDSSPTFDLFMRMVDEPYTSDKTLLLDAIAAYIKEGLSQNDANKQENLAALETFREIAKTLCTVGYDDELDYAVFQNIHILTKQVLGRENAASSVVVLAPPSLNKLAAQQFDKVVFCDVSSRAFNARSKFDALSTLLQKMCIKESHTSSEIARINFLSGIEASKKDVVFCLPSRDLRSNEELTPSFVLQEFFLKKYGEAFDFENLSEQCEKFNIDHRIYGEDNLALIGNAFIEASDVTRSVHPLNFELDSCKDIKKYLKLTDDGKVVLSPSEIEVYCQCPQKWFYERRVSPQVLDYEFNQIEKGNIIHLAFKLFYDELYSQGVFRLSDVEDAKAQYDLFAECYNKAVRQTLSTTTLDEDDEIAKVQDFLNAFDIMQSLNDCLTSLSVQSLIPKNYIVAESEMRIEPAQGVEYAGAVINGALDRLDVSPETDSFIVVDYKGSVKDHGCGKDAAALITSSLEDVPLPRKIQALIYASCVQKITGKKCDAAIYLTYNKLKFDTPPVLGAIDASVIDEFYDVLGNAKDSVVDIGMASYLDATEVRVRGRLEELLNGNVEPRPLTKNTCEFCSVPNCPMRGRG